MSNRLEDFIRDNREQFDGDEPHPRIWNKLEKQVRSANKKGKVIAIQFLRIGVAAVVLLLAGTGVYFLMNDNDRKNGVVKVQPGHKPQTAVDKMLEEINPAYAQEVYHFTRLIELKQNELQQIEKVNPELYKQFIGDIYKLDSSYNALKNELPANPNREQLLEAMILNLQLQSDLLNQQLNIIKQIKQSNSTSHEKNSTI